MANNTINLQDYRTPGAKVFTGRPRGVSVRKDSGIDQLENQFNHITIIIPTDIASINPSFLEEFLENVVKKLGKEGFYNKFTFENEGRYKIEIDLEEAIDRILTTENALP
jgi:hypothetical protein